MAGTAPRGQQVIGCVLINADRSLRFLRSPYNNELIAPTYFIAIRKIKNTSVPATTTQTTPVATPLSVFIAISARAFVLDREMIDRLAFCAREFRDFDQLQEGIGKDVHRAKPPGKRVPAISNG